MKINEDCIACGACLPECPTNSITEVDGTLYVIDQATVSNVKVTLMRPSALKFAL